ncbi:hypothetical protein [Burkholderia ambifaria]|uniref:hypothetical protein n=1 Tax=Burkholderia ambifaria TaxID=152480 RepID=UPI00158946EA|nr:hypothetical protein [Burkholderia ambifaria]
MTIQDIRRANLRRWTEQHGVPSKEKSYFSQLLGGTSFGERAARRLEAEYGMGDGYLDLPTDEIEERNAAAPSPLDVSPEARSLIDAIAAADKIGLSPDAFNALKETLRVFGALTRPRGGTFDVEDPSR